MKCIWLIYNYKIFILVLTNKGISVMKKQCNLILYYKTILKTISIIFTLLRLISKMRVTDNMSLK